MTGPLTARAAPGRVLRDAQRPRPRDPQQAGTQRVSPASRRPLISRSAARWATCCSSRTGTALFLRRGRRKCSSLPRLTGRRVLGRIELPEGLGVPAAVPGIRAAASQPVQFRFGRHRHADRVFRKQHGRTGTGREGSRWLSRPWLLGHRGRDAPGRRVPPGGWAVRSCTSDRAAARTRAHVTWKAYIDQHTRWNAGALFSQDLVTRVSFIFVVLFYLVGSLLVLPLGFAGLARAGPLAERVPQHRSAGGLGGLYPGRTGRATTCGFSPTCSSSVSSIPSSPSRPSCGVPSTGRALHSGPEASQKVSETVRCEDGDACRALLQPAFLHVAPRRQEDLDTRIRLPLMASIWSSTRIAS